MTNSELNQRAIRVPLERGEHIRKKLADQNIIDKSRKLQVKIIDSRKFLEIPIIKDIPGYNIVLQDNPVSYGQMLTLKSILKNKINKSELDELPRGWQILGDIIIVSISDTLSHKKELIADSLLQLYPKIKSVVQDFGISGQYRVPSRTLIRGTKTETIHKENECYYKLDVTKIMFSKGNMHERKLMANIGYNETIVDMFAGIGYFTLQIAKHSKPKQIIAIEINPVSFKYLLENIELNQVQDKVIPINDDCSNAAPVGIADRVIMGYVGITHEYLIYALKSIKNSGGILHYHETVPEPLIETRPVERVKDVAQELNLDIELISKRKVKKYSPGIWHTVFDYKVKNKNKIQ
ncbi:class I SAM-dependent methyltransferase [Methanosalsum natronophilum]|uniref:class I SAM-dependent methyltransferase n=1 Tax=Methanosalsum natronophilum TaxID=768733 RepID=UPI0021689052|nr:class I SAM-dependent methyltransferase family protein [Methanosalsum natronophilum]MCS3924526.1 tRNA wybutosine-synthesizing protein 2 [Methanosalsum natronophilum]